MSIALLAVISGLLFANGQPFANLNPAIQLTTDVKTLTQDGQAVTVRSASSLPSSSVALAMLAAWEHQEYASDIRGVPGT